MNIFLKQMSKTTLKLSTFLIVIMTISCTKEDVPDDPQNPIKKSVFNMLGSIDDSYYLAYTEDLKTGELSFINNGTQLDADQAARVVASEGYVYSLNYGTGILTQLQPKNDGSYELIAEINAGLAVGTNRPRYKLANASTIMVYNVETEPVTDSLGNVLDYICKLRLATVDIPNMNISNLSEFIIPQTENAKQGGTIGFHPMRVDAPVISGSKIYFGLMHTDIFDPSVPPPFRKPKPTGLETLVFDYPSISNGTIVESNSASGHTGGYRAPSMHVDENGNVFQSNWFITGNGFDLSNGDKTVIKKLVNGVYDESYEFNVSDKLGLSSNIGNVGWFYVGNGIGYMPIYMEDEGNYYSEESWTVAKVDLNNQTATKIDVPNSQLFSYESGVVNEGKFYMAISPKNGDSYVYEFDPNSSSAVKGLKLDGDNIHIEGIY